MLIVAVDFRSIYIIKFYVLILRLRKKCLKIRCISNIQI